MPKEVKWLELAEVLNVKFKSEVGVYLEPKALYYLAKKALQNRKTTASDTITWEQFAKEKLQTKPKLEFTFWSWFRAAMKLIKNHLQNYWEEGYVIGFISKDEAGEELKLQPKGTFLLRFSDSVLGAITPCFVKDNETVDNLEPLNTKDLKAQSLDYRVMNEQKLKYIYPKNISKEKVFKRSDVKTCIEGYKKWEDTSE